MGGAIALMCGVDDCDTIKKIQKKKNKKKTNTCIVHTGELLSNTNYLPEKCKHKNIGDLSHVYGSWNDNSFVGSHLCPTCKKNSWFFEHNGYFICLKCSGIKKAKHKNGLCSCGYIYDK